VTEFVRPGSNLQTRDLRFQVLRTALLLSFVHPTSFEILEIILFRQPDSFALAGGLLDPTTLSSGVRLSFRLLLFYVDPLDCRIMIVFCYSIVRFALALNWNYHVGNFVSSQLVVAQPDIC
jgi:hypothetical protein